MLTFYEFMMAYRGKQRPDDQSRLADHLFYDHDFPKHSTNYHELSDYLEWTSPFPNALTLFDELWDTYKLKRAS